MRCRKMINENKYELIKFEDGDFSLDVSVSPNEETVWLTQAQIAELYKIDRSRVTRHINNIISDNELCIESNVRKTHFPNSDKPVYIYNLDMILAVGYRVNSKRGIQFRRWANYILKQYLLNGQVINETRCLAHSDNIVKLTNKVDNVIQKVENLELRLDSITSIDIFKDKIFYNGQVYEGYSFVKNLFHKAKNRIIIIDGYLNYSVLEMINDITTNVTICIASHTPITNREISLFQTNHNLNVIRTNNYHDRFIIIDDELYNVGSSIKDIGKKVSHISKLETINIEELLKKYI